ncbi:hypothetical protein KAU43_03660 [candidate division WOR-3 bacterium]|nr:hypothetical protein [candidate division WOR-3 bacterium]
MGHWTCYALWIWECTHDDCFGCSTVPLPRKKARRQGVRHMQEYHDEKTEPKLTKVCG